MKNNRQYIRRLPVDSEAVLSVGYDVQRRMLQIEYSGGNVYNYFDVPPYIYEDLMKATSIGTFCNQHIRNEYDYELIAAHKKAG